MGKPLDLVGKRFGKLVVFDFKGSIRNRKGICERWWKCSCDCGETSGKRKCKSFSLNKYGSEVAWKMACEERERMIKELNEQGADYAPKHGL